MKAVVAVFNQEKALVRAFPVIVQLHRFIYLQHQALVRGMKKWVNTAPEAEAAEHRKNAPLVPTLLITRGKA